MFALLVAGMGILAEVGLKPEDVILTGLVRDSAGRPIPKATVFIRTAGPRQGVGVL